MDYIYVLSLLLCWIWVGIGLESVTHRSIREFYGETIPFGLGSPALPGLAGFGAIPILNTLLAVGCIVHAVWWHRNKAS